MKKLELLAATLLLACGSFFTKNYDRRLVGEI
jgi:hypothetical protein